MSQIGNNNLANIIDKYQLSNSNIIKNSKTILGELVDTYTKIDNLYKELLDLKDSNDILREKNKILSDKYKQLIYDNLENSNKLSEIEISKYDLEIALKNCKKLLQSKTKTIINYCDVTNKELTLKDGIINDFKKYSESLENKLKILNCKICLNNIIKLVFIPCGHSVTCVSCYNNLEEKICPVCRTNIDTTQELFI